MSIATEDLSWAKWYQKRCRAVTDEPPYYGRCELIRNHPEELHALDRGFDIPRWSTKWVEER